MRPVHEVNSPFERMQKAKNQSSCQHKWERDYIETSLGRWYNYDFTCKKCGKKKQK